MTEKTPPLNAGRPDALIRDARPDEASALSRLAFAAKAALGHSLEDLERWRADLTVAPSDFARLRIRTLVTGDGSIAGFHAILLSGPTASLEHLWVDPARWRGGLGRLLLDDARRLALAAGAIALEIDAEPLAGPFYERLGARPVGSVPAPTGSDPGRRRPQYRILLP